MLLEKILNNIPNKLMDNSNSYPFEVHITVKPDNVERFKDVCKELNIKPVLLDLQNHKTQTIMKDLMTSSTYKNNFKEVWNHISIIVKKLEISKFEVLRVKVETIPSHPLAPQTSLDKMPKDCYYESHIGILLSNDEDENKADFLSKSLRCHLSRNAFKKHQDGRQSIKMLTYRKYDGTSQEFINHVSNICNQLTEQSLHYEKVIHEFACYDSNDHHDQAWIQSH
jgi:hypothetical protein